MKRFLACLLILLLPLQSAWAVAGAFCGDGGVPMAEHHAHHAHDAPAISDTAVADGDQAPPCAALDGHCAACHTGCCVGTGTVVPAISLRDDAPVAAASPLLPSPASQRPERPKWLVPA